MASYTVPDVAVDLGSASIRVGVRGQGVALDFPTVIALQGRDVVAVGEQAARMEGRSPAGVSVVRPVQGAAVVDFHATERLLAHALRKIGGTGLRKPRVLLALPSDTSEVERRAALECIRAAGARDVVTCDTLMVAAFGVGLPVEEPTGHMVVDLGSGGTRAAIVAMGGPVIQRTTQVGGAELNLAIRDWLRADRAMLVEDRTAENLKQHLVDLSGQTTRQVRIRGRDASRERAVEESVSSPDLGRALIEPVKRIRETVRSVLRHASPELSADLLDRGMILCGGGGALRGLDGVLRKDTGLAVLASEKPRMAVIQGCLTLLAEPDRYARRVLGNP